MTETSPPQSVPVILDLDGVQQRYGIGRTKATEFVASAGFPNSVVPGMHRYPLVALEAWELAHALQGTVAEPAAPQPPVFVTPPEPGQRGRRPSTRGTS